MRPVSRKTWTRGPLPQFVEWVRVGSSALLFDSLRRHFQARPRGGQRSASLVHRPLSKRFAELTLCHAVRTSEAEAWLRDEALARFPDSIFAKCEV